MGNEEFHGVHKKKRKKSIDGEVEAAKKQILDEEGNAAKKKRKKSIDGEVEAAKKQIIDEEGNAAKKKRKKSIDGEVEAAKKQIVDEEGTAAKKKRKSIDGEVEAAKKQIVDEKGNAGKKKRKKSIDGEVEAAKKQIVDEEGTAAKKKRKSIDGEVEAAKKQIVDEEGNAGKKKRKKSIDGEAEAEKQKKSIDGEVEAVKQIVDEEGNAGKKQRKKSIDEVEAAEKQEGNAGQKRKKEHSTGDMAAEISQSEIEKLTEQGRDGLANERLEVTQERKGENFANATVEHKKKLKREGRKKKSAPTHIAGSHGEATGEQQGSRSDNATEKTRKKVTFGDVSVLGPQGDEIETKPEDISEEQATAGNSETNQLWNKWFTKEEDKILREAACRAVEEKGWTQEQGFRILLFTDERKGSDKKKARECWKAIAAQLPHRNPGSVRTRGAMILDTFHKVGKWSQEDHDLLKRLIEEHGHNWKKIAKILGRRSRDVRQKWRYGRNQKNRGRWKLEEMEKMCKLVHESLAMDVKLGTRLKRKRLDDVPWTAVADTLGTRPDTHCMRRWYDILCSSMVKHGEWSNKDDHNLLLRLLESGAPDEDSVDWDKLLEHRSGELCLKRWKQMTSHLGRNRNKPFETKLELLVKRYAPCFLEDEEKPCVLESSSPGTNSTERHHGCD